MFLLLVAANFLGPVLACGMQRQLRDSMVTKHLLGLMTMFFAVQLAGNGGGATPGFLMLSSGVMYLLFLVFAKCQYVVMSAIVLILFAYAVLSTYKTYYEQKAETVVAHRIDMAMTVMLVSVLVLLPIGYVWYFLLKRREFEGQWDWMKFVLGVIECKFDGDRGLQQT